MSSTNGLLAALPRDQYAMLLPQLQRIHLPKGKVLWELGEEIRYAYFPEGGMASLLSLTSEGETVEVATVGDDGVLGVECILQTSTASHRIMIQMLTDAFRIKVEILRTAFDRSPHLRGLLHLDLQTNCADNTIAARTTGYVASWRSLCSGP